MRKKMKIPLILPFLFIAVFTCALYAGKSDKPAADDTTNRIDFTLGANEVTVLQGGSGSPAAAVQAAGQQQAVQDGQAAQGTAEYYPSLSFFEFDLLSIKRSLDSNAVDINFRAGFGDYQNFGFDCAGDTYFYMNDPRFEFAIEMDLVFAYYPFGNSPSGWYMSLAFGGNIWNIMDNTLDEWIFSMPFYGETGYRLILDWFVADVSVSYGPRVYFVEPVAVQWEFFLRAGIGWVFDINPPKAKKAEKNEPAEEKKGILKKLP
jgi:hypothetical protein